MKQKTLRVFEVDDFEKLEKIVSSKFPLLKNHFFLLKEHNEKIENFLKEKGLNYFVLNSEAFIKEKEKIIIKEIEKEVVKKVKPKIFDRIIRSGEEIVLEEEGIFLNRINAGAKVKAYGNLSILDENEGFIECHGDYVFVYKNLKGNIIFNGENLGVIDKPTFFGLRIKKVLK